MKNGFRNNDAFAKARKSLSEIFNHYSFVVLDRFPSAGRTAYNNLEELRPLISAGYYEPWSYLGLQNTINLESESNYRDAKQKHKWTAQILKEVESKIKETGKKPAISVWFSSKATKELSDKLGGIEIAIPEDARSHLENKSNLNDILLAAGVSKSLIINAINSDGDTPPYQTLQKRFGNVFVMQNHQSSGGKGTHFIRSEKDFMKAKLLSNNWKISEYKSGFSSNVTILTLPDENGGCSVYVDVPSHKGSNSPEQGIIEGKSAGNEWSQEISETFMLDIIDAAIKVGQYAFQKHGLVGIWGMDLILSPDGIKVNEINPRLQGTTEVSAINQTTRGLPPFIAAHVVHFCGGKVDWMPSQNDFNNETLQIATKQRVAPFYIKIRNTSDKDILQNISNGSGIYKISTDTGNLIWLRDGASAEQAKLSAGEILLANIPSNNVLCAAGAELGTIEGMTKEKLFSETGGLTPLGKKVVKTVKKHFGI